MNVTPSVATWLEQFAACVRARDLQQGRELFDEDVRAFGTRADDVKELAQLVEHQWSHIWFHTRGFHFIEESVQTMVSDDGSQVCVLAHWKSEGLDPEKTAFTRRGRCTILLRRSQTHPTGMVAIHTHFSKTPSTEL